MHKDPEAVGARQTGKRAAARIPDLQKSGPCPLCGGAPEFDAGNLAEGDFELFGGRIRCRACGAISTNLIFKMDSNP